MNMNLENKIAAAIAHRACCGCEQMDGRDGKLHGYCVVCGVEWPCETAKQFLFKFPSLPPAAPVEDEFEKWWHGNSVDYPNVEPSQAKDIWIATKLNKSQP